MPSGGSQGTSLSHEGSLSQLLAEKNSSRAPAHFCGLGPWPCTPSSAGLPRPPRLAAPTNSKTRERPPLSCGAIPPTDPDPQLSGPPCVPRLSPPLPAPGLGGIPGAAGWVIPTAGTEDVDGASCSAREPSSPGRISSASVFLWDAVRLWWGCSSVSESAGCDVGCRVLPSQSHLNL